MANVTNVEFERLDISGKNYMSWVLDAEIHLDANELSDTIKESNTASMKDRTKAMIFLRHHIHDNLKQEYLTVKDPAILWKNLKERYDHLRTVVLPKARYEWIHLRLMDFKTIDEYDSAMHRITSQLQLCGDEITEYDKLEKTYFTFHSSYMLLQQQYREKGYKRYSDLISSLLVAEQNNEILLKNAEACPSGSAPFSEANASVKDNIERESGRKNDQTHGSGYGRNQSQSHGRGRGGGRGRGRGKNWYYDSNRSQNNHQKWKGKGVKCDKFGTNNNNVCHRFGMKGHWSRTCRIPQHLAELYQASQKKKEKEKETNFVYENDNMEVDFPTDTHLDVSDFLNPTEGN